MAFRDGQANIFFPIFLRHSQIRYCPDTMEDRETLLRSGIASNRTAADGERVRRLCLAQNSSSAAAGAQIVATSPALSMDEPGPLERRK